MSGGRALQGRRTIDGAGIHFTEAGAGDPLLFVHGVPTSSFLWRKVQEQLCDEYRAVAIDLLGFGGSDKPEHRDISLGAQAELVARFALELDAGPVTLVGHDWGGAIAQLVAARFPGVLSRLILVSAHTEGTWPPGEYAQFRSNGAAVHATVEHLQHYLRETLPMQVAHKEDLNDDILQSYLAPWATPAAMGSFFQLMQVPQAGLLRRAELDLSRCWIPTLVIWGDKDSVIPIEEGQRLARHLPGASMENIAGAGHLLPEEAASALSGSIRSFHRRTTRAS